MVRCEGVKVSMPALEWAPKMRCYFMRDGRIAAVEFLDQNTEKNDEERVARSLELYAEKGMPAGADGFEVWEGPRQVHVAKKRPTA